MNSGSCSQMRSSCKCPIGAYNEDFDIQLWCRPVNFKIWLTKNTVDLLFLINKVESNLIQYKKLLLIFITHKLSMGSNTREMQTSYIILYNPSNIFARARLVKTRHVTQYAPTKIGEYPSNIPQFK